MRHWIRGLECIPGRRRGIGPGSGACWGDVENGPHGSGAYKGDVEKRAPAWGHVGETRRGSGSWGKTIASCGLLLGTLLFFIRVCRLADNRHFDLGCIMK